MDDDTDKRKIRKNHTTKLTLIFLSIIGFLVWLGASPSKETPAPSPTPLTAEQKAAKLAVDAKVRQETINSVAPSFCKEHQNVQMDKTDYLIKDGWPVFSSVERISKGQKFLGWTSAECSVIISKFYDSGSTADELSKIAAGKIWIGMQQTQLIYSAGEPDKINSTTTAAGTSQQWVYGDSYVYLDGGTVTSYQN